MAKSKAKQGSKSKRPYRRPRISAQFKILAMRLFRADVEAVRALVHGTDVSVATKLRALVHEALVARRLKVWKFWVTTEESVELSRIEDANGPGKGGTITLTASGAIVAVIAESEEHARQEIKDWAAREGRDARWVDQAKHVASITLDKPGFILMVT